MQFPSATHFKYPLGSGMSLFFTAVYTLYNIASVNASPFIAATPFYNPEPATSRGIILSFISLSKTEIFIYLSCLAATLLIIIYLIRRMQKQKRTLEKKISSLVSANHGLKEEKKAAQGQENLRTEFLAGMSHEIRTPMNTVLGFTDILLGQTSDEQQVKYLQAIRSATKNLLTLIDDILDLSRIENNNLKIAFEPANPRMIFNDVENTFAKQAAEKQIGFAILIDARLPQVLLMDEIRVRQILFKLVGNAVKYSGNGSVRVVVKVLNERSSPSHEVDFSVDVHDSGPGMSAEQQKAIAEAFTRNSETESTIGSTGLGLYISRKLAGLMNGEITFVSDPGKGSTFSFLLKGIKVLKTEPPPTDRKDFNIKNIRFDQALVLVADDVVHNRFLIREFLKNSNLQTIEASDGQEALDEARKHKPAVVLMDIRMPTMDGIEATRQIRQEEELKDIRVIALTASVREEEIKKIANAGFDDFLKKPVKLTSIIRMLSKYLTYQVVENKPNEKPETGNLAPETQEDAIGDELVELLEGQILMTWKEVNQGGFIDEITKFGIELQDIGTEHSCKTLALYGKSLVDSSESFDVSSMKKILNQFPRFVDQLKMKK